MKRSNADLSYPKLDGHKCLGATMCFEVDCECGWVSCAHRGEGARSAAYAEWRDHMRSTHALHTPKSHP